MSTRFVDIDRSTPMLLPPDMRSWVPEDDLVHFVLEAVEMVPLTEFEVNQRGTGSAQYPPRMMLALLIYCYANGLFSSCAKTIAANINKRTMPRRQWTQMVHS